MNRPKVPFFALVAGLIAVCSACGSAGGSAPVAARSTAAGKPVCTGPATATASGGLRPVTSDPSPALPVTYTDVTGRDVVVTDTTRILALDSYGTLATTVYALGLGDRLVGRDVSTGLPELAHLPVVTHNGHELNGEAILNLRPTVVLTDYTIGPLEVQLQLMESKIPVAIMSDQRSRDAIAPQIRSVAQVLGVPDLGSRLATRVERDTRAAERRVAEMAPDAKRDKLRMAFLYMRGNAGVFYWFGKGSGADDLIASLGGRDVATEVGLAGNRPINAEGLVKADPDLFLMMSKGLESVGGVTGLLEVPGIAETTAGTTSCVVDMSDHLILSFGPLFPSTLDALASAIYEQAAA